MLILERSFATSKRPEPTRTAPLRAALFWSAAALYLFQSTCIVTDEVEFELAINHAVQIVSTLPSSETVQAVASGGDKYALSVIVRDPDVQGSPLPPLEAQIALSLEPFAPDFDNPANRNPSCEPPQLLEPLEDDHIAGSRYEIRCLVDFTDAAVTQTLHVGDWLLARVLVSDQGFVSGSVPENATTALARWSLYVAEAME